jgi:hypothetical protein
VISLPQVRNLYTGQHKDRINAYTDIHALSGIRTHDSSVRASENGLTKANRTTISVKQFYCGEQRQTKINEHVQTVRIASWRYFLCRPIIVPDAVGAQCKIFCSRKRTPTEQQVTVHHDISRLVSLLATNINTFSYIADSGTTD